MKKKIIITAVAIIIIGVFAYQAYVIYQVKKQADLSVQVLNIMGTPDKDGVTGFDRLVVQTLNKINQTAKK